MERSRHTGGKAFGERGPVGCEEVLGPEGSQNGESRDELYARHASHRERAVVPMRRVERRHGPTLLAAGFGSYFAIVMVVAWTFASRLTSPWYGPEISRWAYTVYLIASAIFLAGLGVLAFQVQNSFEHRVREVNRQLGSLFWDWSRPTEAEDSDPSTSPRDPDEEDLDEILQTVGEAQTREVQEVLLRSSYEAAEEDAPVEIALVTVAQPEMLRRREGLKRQARSLAKYFPGPMGIAVTILGVSAAMLPGVEAMLQDLHQLNTALILGFAYGWVGLAGYFAASSIAILFSFRTQRKPRGR